MNTFSYSPKHASNEVIKVFLRKTPEQLELHILSEDIIKLIQSCIIFHKYSMSERAGNLAKKNDWRVTKESGGDCCCMRYSHILLGFLVVEDMLQQHVSNIVHSLNVSHSTTSSVNTDIHLLRTQK